MTYKTGLFEYVVRVYHIETKKEGGGGTSGAVQRQGGGGVRSVRGMFTHRHRFLFLCLVLSLFQPLNRKIAVKAF